MVLEHVFVTRMDGPATMTRATDYLVARGFGQKPQDAFPVGQAEWSAIELARGKKKAARAKNVRELPQTVRVEWDRGRVTVALSISHNVAWGGGGSFGAAVEKPKKMVLHRQMLDAIARGLEGLLGHDGQGVADYTHWDAAEAQILAAARRRRIRGIIALIIVLGLLAGLITLIAVAAMH